MTVIYGIKNCDTIKKACLQVSPTTRSTASIATGWRNGHWLIELDAKIGRLSIICDDDASWLNYLVRARRAPMTERCAADS
jgi:hypothetical protein